MLLVSRLFAGAATANIAIARAFVADVTAPEGRARGMGIIGAAFGLGFVLGPAIGGVLSHYSLSLPGFAAAALAAVNGIAAWFILPEPEHRFSVDRRPRFAAMREELARPGIRRVIGIYFITVLAFSAMEATYAFLARQRYGLAESSVSLRVRLHRRAARDRAGRAHRPTLAPLRREARSSSPASSCRRSRSPRSRSASAAGAPRGDRAARDRRGPHPAALSALLSRFARAQDQGGTLGIGESAAAFGRIIGPEAGTWTFGQWSSRSLTSAARRSWRSRRRWA